MTCVRARRDGIQTAAAYTLDVLRRTWMHFIKFTAKTFSLSTQTEIHTVYFCRKSLSCMYETRSLPVWLCVTVDACWTVSELDLTNGTLHAHSHSSTQTPLIHIHASCGKYHHSSCFWWARVWQPLAPQTINNKNIRWAQVDTNFVIRIHIHTHKCAAVLCPCTFKQCTNTCVPRKHFTAPRAVWRDCAHIQCQLSFRFFTIRNYNTML